MASFLSVLSRMRRSGLPGTDAVLDEAQGEVGRALCPASARGGCSACAAVIFSSVQVVPPSLGKVSWPQLTERVPGRGRNRGRRESQACRAALSVSKIHTPLSERGRVIGSGQVNHSDMRCRPSPSAEVGEFAAVGPVIGGGEVRELRAFTL